MNDGSSEWHERRNAEIDLAILATEFKNLNETVSGMSVRFDRMETKLETLSFVHPEVYLADRKALIDRLKALESFKEWFFRLIAGAILVGLVGTLMAVKS